MSDTVISYDVDKAESLVQKDKVISTLRANLAAASQSSIQQLADYVMKAAKKVFLTLVFTDTIKHIDKLQRDGFGDNDLPVYSNSSPNNSNIHEVRSLESNALQNGFADWSLREVDSFCQQQWVFLAPVFQEDKFVYTLYKGQPLPFIPAEKPRGYSGRFGTVQKLRLYPTHYQRASTPKKGADDKIGRAFDVALKRLGPQNPETERFYKKEMDTLSVMRGLDNRHLIKAIATFSLGSERYFLFPWADGGNLQEMLKNDERGLDRELVSWALSQALGLSSGISQLNGLKIRHGDIKPSNIVCFGSPTGPTLVITDVGLAKHHKEDTRDRINSTTTRHGSMAYEPPEVTPKSGKVILSTKRYDVWSLGCVCLELIIWLVYGRASLGLFHKALNRDPTNCKFWMDHAVWGRKKHVVVKKWLKKLKGDLKEASALHDVVKLIEKKLLVLADDRADSKSLYNTLESIAKKASQSPQYLFDAGIEKLASKRKTLMLGDPADEDLLISLSSSF